MGITLYEQVDEVLKDEKLADPCTHCGNRQLTPAQLEKLIQKWYVDVLLPQQRLKWLENALIYAAETQPRPRLLDE